MTPPSIGPAATALVREPFTLRARRELVWCVLTVGAGALGFAVIVASLVPGTAVSAIRGAIILSLLPLLLVATGGAHRVGEAFRELAHRVLGEAVPAPPPLGAARTDRLAARAAARFRDTSSWRALAYLGLKLPLALLGVYALAFWWGAVNLTYPFWWRLFRNHPPGSRLRPFPVITPLGAFEVRSFPGTLLVFLVGAAMVAAAPWATRAVVSVDRWLVRSLLGPGRLAERVRTLEETRAHVVDDAAATLRRIERDLHDGTQAQLATLAMKLGQAKEKLEHGGEVPFDPDGALELLDLAHRQAKETLVELRNLARGIHPPALDVGLEAALTTLVARSAVPTALSVHDLAGAPRPSPAIEAIAYFSVAELLANVAKHSGAAHAEVTVRADDGVLRMSVADDGVGGARPGAGSGLDGLADRVRAVDGELRVDSPPGGPTVVTVGLPIRAPR
jgi:signal transduction histidine kinase